MTSLLYVVAEVMLHFSLKLPLCICMQLRL